MDILAKKIYKKFTKIWNFRPNTAFGDSPYLNFFLNQSTQGLVAGSDLFKMPK